jgi:hypothetical protein
VKADSAERKKDQRLRDFTEKPDAPVIDGDYTVLDESEPQGNGADPEASAEDMKAKFAELDEGDEEQEPEALVQARKDYYASLEPPPSIAPNDDMQPALFSMAGTMANEAKRFKEFLARSTVSRELIDEVDKALDAWRDISIELEDRLERQQADEDGWIEGDPK